MTAVAWHPFVEGLLAFGTEEGRVGLYEVFSARHAVYAACASAGVVGLSWRPTAAAGYAEYQPASPESTASVINSTGDICRQSTTL